MGDRAPGVPLRSGREVLGVGARLAPVAVAARAGVVLGEVGQDEPPPAAADVELAKLVVEVDTQRVPARRG